MASMNMVLPHPIVYVTRDIERALGTKPINNYFIVANKTPYAESVRVQFPENIFLFQKENDELFDTYELLEQPEVINFIHEHEASVLVFQNTPRIERLCQKNNIHLLNPDATLARTIEEKISQVMWLEGDKELLPPHEVTTLELIDIEKQQFPFVLQFNHSHTGEGTYIINTINEFTDLKNLFPKRDVRLTRFIQGPVFTLNTVVGKHFEYGNISYQITGLAPFTDLPFATIGNDWKLPRSILTEQEREKIAHIARRVGERLQKQNWKGLFGIDVIQDSKTRDIFLLEINARQPASTTLESILQDKQSPSIQTIFEKHLLALIEKDTPEKKTPRLTNGAQILQRITNSINAGVIKIKLSTLPPSVFAVIQYNNTAHNKDLLRIQSTEGLLESHTGLNAIGKQIKESLT